MDLTELEQNIKGAITGNGESAIGANSKDLTGVAIDSPRARGIFKSPCVALKWLNQNTPYTYQTFVELEFDGGIQGIRAFNDKGNKIAEITVPIMGGVDSDPMEIIYSNNAAIINETLKYVVSLQD